MPINPASLNEFSKIPGSLLKDITSDPNKPANQPGTGDTPASPNKTEPDIFATGDIAKQQVFSNTNSGSNNAPNANPGNPTGPNDPKKSLAAIAGDKGAGMATDLTDMIMSALMYVCVSKAGYEIDKKACKISADQKEVLTSAWKALLEHVYIDLSNPWAQFGLIFGIVYGTKTAVVMAEARKKEPEKKEQKKAPVVEIPAEERSTDKKNNLVDRQVAEYERRWKDLVKSIAASQKIKYDKAEQNLKKKGQHEILWAKIIKEIV